MNNGGETVVVEGYLQDDEGARMASGVYIGLCEDKIGSPMSKRNRGFSRDNEDIKEQSGLHADNVEQT